MEQVNPEGSELRSLGDYQLVKSLLNNPRYNIPERLRKKAITCIEDALDNVQSDDKLKLTAVKVLSELDKRNIELVKMSMPKRVEHFDPRKANDEELLKLVKNVVKLMPPTLTTSGEAASRPSSARTASPESPGVNFVVSTPL